MGSQIGFHFDAILMTLLADPTLLANHRLSYKYKNSRHRNLSLVARGDLEQKLSSSEFIFNYSQGI